MRRRDRRPPWGASITIYNSLTGCSGHPSHFLCLSLSHLETGVTLWPVCSNPPHCSCKDRLHRDKATYYSAPPPPSPPTRCVSSSHPPPPDTHTHTFTVITHIFFVSFHGSLRFRLVIVASFPLATHPRLFHPIGLDLVCYTKTMQILQQITSC